MTGLQCPRCLQTNHSVVATDPGENAILRRRECKNCGKRFNTSESTEQIAGELAAIRRHLEPLVEIVKGQA